MPELATPTPTILGPQDNLSNKVLSPEALDFITALQLRFNARRLELLEARHARQKRLDAGELPQFLPETAEIRAATWQIALAPG